MSIAFLAMFAFALTPMIFGKENPLNYVFGVLMGGLLFGIRPQISQLLDKKILYKKAVANMKEPTAPLDLETLGKST